MKKRTLFGFLFFGLCMLIFAQSDLQAIARVNLLKPEPITLGQLKKIVNGFEAQAGRKLTFDERSKLLDGLIGQRLLSQAAEKEGIKILDSEVNNYFEGLLSQQVNRPITEAEFAKLIKQEHNQSLDQFFKTNTGNSVAETKKMLKDEIMIQKFVMSKKQAEIQRNAIPTDADIRKQYELNKQSFFRPEMVKLALIGVFKKGDNTGETKKITALNNKLKKNIKELPQIKRNAEKEGYIVQDRFALKNAAGAKELNLKIEELMQIFEKPVNFVSDITDMPDNKQFFVITEKFPDKLLALSDVIDPTQTVTVYEAIKASLTQQMQTFALQQANHSLIQELKTNSNHKILLSGDKLKKALSW